MEEKLKKLGFGKNDIKVYLALFELGKTKAGAIIDHTSLHRNLVYTSLEELTQRKLVTKTIVNGVATFVANDPRTILDELEDKKQLAQSVIEALERKQEESPQEITVYEGIEGIRRARNQTLNMAAGSTLHVLGASHSSTTPEWERYWKSYHTKREKKGIGMRILYEQGVAKEVVEWRDNLELSTAKYLPFLINSPMEFNFINDYVYLNIMSADTPMAIKLRSRTVADAFRKFFDFFWDQKVQVFTGDNAVKNAFYSLLGDLQGGETYRVLGASGGGYSPEMLAFFETYHADRIKKGVVVEMLASHEYITYAKDVFARGGDENGDLSVLKPFTSMAPQPFQINLYSGKTQIIIYEDEPVVLLFENDNLFEGFQTYFNSFWSQETVIMSGPQAVKDIWLEAIEATELNFIGARGYFIDAYPKEFEHIRKKAETTDGIVWRNIVDAGVRGHQITEFPWVQTKYSLQGIKNPNVVWLYGNTVAISNWTSKEPIVFKSTNPQLVQSYRDYFNALWGQHTHTFTGSEGIMHLCETVLAEGDDIYLIGATGAIAKTHAKYYEEFTAKRIRKNLTLNMLAHDYLRGSEFTSQFLSNVTYLPKDFESPMVIWVFGDYVANVMWHDPQTIVLIHDAKVADAYRTYYNAMAKQARK